jgi:hypothetical protein
MGLVVSMPEAERHVALRAAAQAAMSAPPALAAPAVAEQSNTNDAPAPGAAPTPLVMPQTLATLENATICERAQLTRALASFGATSHEDNSWDSTRHLLRQLHPSLAPDEPTQCPTCGERETQCVCLDVVRKRETKARASASIVNRITFMIKFMQCIVDDLGPSPDAVKAGRRAIVLEERGDQLHLQNTLLNEQCGNGSLTVDIVKVHRDAVDAWMRECDEFNLMVWRAMTKQQQQSSQSLTIKDK